MKAIGHRDINPASPQPKRIAMVVSNPATSTTTGWPVGFWWSEVAHPFHVFAEQGYDVEIFSPDGGPCEGDPLSDPRDPSRWSAGDLITTGFVHTPEYADLLKATSPVAKIDPGNFDAIVVAGGQGPMFTLGKVDPVHRASNLTSVGFVWSRLSEMMTLTVRDKEVLEAARREGIGDGFTVPAHVPGEAHGSCSFACATGEHFSEEHLALLQLVGAFAFEAARRMRRMREPNSVVRLTDRQTECVIWAARGKSDWEISQILGISHETVIQHLKQARERYDVGKRTLLAIHALFDGTIGFLDVLRR